MPRARKREIPLHRKGKKVSRIFLMARFMWVAFGDAIRPIKKVESDPIVVDPNQIQIWMIGHATVFINFYGTTILTDPIFVNWIPFPKRHVTPGFEIEDLPEIDIVAVSHAHWDHLNKRSLKKLAKKTKTLVIAKNCHDLVEKIPFENVVELDWDSVVELAGVTIHVYKPQHWGRRLPWESFQRGYNSYLFEKNGKKVFFCGDSAYCDMFGHVGEKHDVDIALLPIGAYNPPSFRKVHMDPHDALRAYYDLQAELLIPMHWGNFRLSREPMKEPAWLLGELARERRLSGIQILQNGHSHTVD